jgi:plasmid replication initiation protein
MAVAALPKKDNALITASYGLSVAESRLVLLAIIIAKEYLHTAQSHSSLDKRIEISAQRYVDMFGVSKSSAYELLQDTCRSLFKRQFSYTEAAESAVLWHRTSHWVIDISYMNETETVALSFSPAIIASIDDLQKHLSSYDVRKVANLTNARAIRLYELMKDLHHKSKTSRVSIEDLRSKLGILEYEYKRMFDFKRQVLDYAIEQINEHTDLKVSYKQHKTVRTISAFTFNIELKKDTSQA